jgi:hypothetical protein
MAAAKWYAKCSSSGAFDRTTVGVIFDLRDEFKDRAGLDAVRIANMTVCGGSP